MKKRNKNILRFFGMVFFMLGFLVLGANVGLAWSGTLKDWQYRQLVTIQGAKIDGTAAHANFPVLVSVTNNNLKSTANGGHVAKENGGDILFADAANNQLDHEVEKYDPVSGELMAWVRISSLVPATNKGIYMYYGNPTAGNQWEPEDVWNSGYKGVWHLRENDPGEDRHNLYQDSTSRNHSGDDSISATGKGGKIGLGQELEGDASPPTGKGDNIYFGEDDDWDLRNENFTMEVWFKINTAFSPPGSYGYRTLFNVYGYSWSPSKSETYYNYAYMNTWSPGTISYNFTSDTSKSGNNDLTLYPGGNYKDGNWHQLVVTANQNEKRGYMYIDGVQKASDSFNKLRRIDDLYLGNSKNWAGYNWPGNLDEFRISHVDRSAAWIKTQYNNQGDPTSFLAFGTEENSTPPGDTTPPERSNGFPVGKWTIPSALAKIKISLETNEKAVCKYSDVSMQSYDAMTDTFLSDSAGTSHWASIDIPGNNSPFYYVKCRDISGNANYNDYVITFDLFIYTSQAGLWSHYSALNNATNRRDTYKNSNVDNVNFGSNFKNIKSAMAGKTLARVNWDGGIFIETPGVYSFKIDKDRNGSANAFMFDGSTLRYDFPGSTDYTVSMNLTPGWHHIEFLTEDDSDNNRFVFYWTPPGKSQEPVPKEVLIPITWSEEELLIPPVGQAKVKLNYFTAGVGTEDNSNPAIEVELPPGVTESLILKDYVYAIMTYESNVDLEEDNGGYSPSTVQNIFGSGTMNLSYVKADIDWVETDRSKAFGKIPKSLIRVNSNKLRFEFPGLQDLNNGGVAIMIPYQDNTMIEGRVRLKLNTSYGYMHATSTLVFPLKSNGAMNQFSPFFIMGDGETKYTMPGGYRPNYVVALSGSGTPPGDLAILKNMAGARMIIPESGSIPVLSNPQTWYLAFGREGSLDVVSPNYAKNLDLGSATGANDGRLMTPITVAPSDEWIAFQYYGSNIDDGSPDGSGESGTLAGGGMFTEADPTLKVCRNSCDSGSIVSDGASYTMSPGDSAYYVACWGMTAFCDEAGDDVTGDAQWKYSGGYNGVAQWIASTNPKQLLAKGGGTEDLTVSYVPETTESINFSVTVTGTVNCYVCANCGTQQSFVGSTCNNSLGQYDTSAECSANCPTSPTKPPYREVVP